jgi:hypothetical protein
MPGMKRRRLLGSGVEHATTESFKDSRRFTGPLALEATDFTSRVRILKTVSEPVGGRPAASTSPRRRAPTISATSRSTAGAAQ